MPSGASSFQAAETLRGWRIDAATGAQNLLSRTCTTASAAIRCQMRRCMPLAAPGDATSHLIVKQIACPARWSDQYSHRTRTAREDPQLSLPSSDAPLSARRTCPEPSFSPKIQQFKKGAGFNLPGVGIAAAAGAATFGEETWCAADARGPPAAAALLRKALEVSWSPSPLRITCTRGETKNGRATNGEGEREGKHRTPAAQPTRTPGLGRVIAKRACTIDVWRCRYPPTACFRKYPSQRGHAELGESLRVRQALNCSENVPGGTSFTKSLKGPFFFFFLVRWVIRRTVSL